MTTATTATIERDPTSGLSEGRSGRPLTDMGNAERLADREEGRLLYVRGPGWYAWDGRRWKRAIEGEEVRAYRDMVRSIYGESARASTSASRRNEAADRKAAADGAEALGRWAKSSEAATKAQGALHYARADERLVASPSSLDANPDALNVANGVLDLATLELRSHDPAERHTRIASAAFLPGAHSGRWDYFLSEIVPDVENRRYLQKAAGISLVGHFSEHLFIPWGSGRNGKSTFLWAVRHALGDYAMEAAPDLLVDSGRKRNAGDMSAAADLMGRRFVTTVETGEGKRLDETLVKQLTGEHTLKSKYMRQDFFEFENQTSIWLATNHKPYVLGSDVAIWERLHLIPFDQYIPEDRRDPDLGRALEEDRDAVLAWAVEGLRLYREEGLKPPPDIAAATAEYRSEMDPMREWMDSCCDLGDASARTAAAAIRRSYEDHCRRARVEPLKVAEFNERLEARGLKKGKARLTPGENAVHYRQGISVYDDSWHEDAYRRVMAATRAAADL